ncbi:MAG: POT family MFS transporter [Bdellovibrionales bacterium]|nr:POT family MFS transporter [Bdellovibrionales bacterium]
MNAATHAQDKFPPQIKFIIGNEGCERFSFYGMRAILTVFMVQYLAIKEVDATAVYHIFIAACYLMPLAGGYLADRFFGKYHVILYLSLFYCLGHGVIALFENEMGLYWGLGLIAIGSGGIKPCVSAFVGDQFRPDQDNLIKKVYNLFYWIINFGSASSTIITPLLLAFFSPSVAFGIPGVLMAIATLIFWSGRKHYVNAPPSGKNPHSLPRVLLSAIKNIGGGSGFLNNAKKDHPSEAVDAVKSVFNIMKIFFVAVPVFWALFDQHGSTWVHQARAMKPDFLGITIQPSQIQALNPFMVMTLIPIFVFGIYPWVGKFYNLTPLRRMGWGMVIAAFSFVQVGLIQYVLDAGTPLNIAWQFFPYLTITIAEVMISITGLEFAYTQAPKSMKSVIMSFWMLTTFLGNVYVAFVAKINVFEGGHFFMFFAALMLVVAGAFAWLASSYKYQN